MKAGIVVGVMIGVFAAGVVAAQGQTATPEPTMTSEPVVSLKEALSLADQYVLEKKVDVSRHFMESVRLVYVRGVRQWIVTWQLKEPSDGGQVFIHVYLDKSVSMIEGL